MYCECWCCSNCSSVLVMFFRGVFSVLWDWFSTFPLSLSCQICNLYVGYLSIPFSFVTSIVSMEKFLVLMKTYWFSYMLLLLRSCHSLVIICLLQATMSEGCVTFKNLVPYWCVIFLAVRQYGTCSEPNSCTTVSRPHKPSIRALLQQEGWL